MASVVPVLAGCLEPRPGIEQLPEPPARTIPAERPIYIPPPPKPVAPLAPPAPKGKPIRGAVIVVDAGHGGKDPGGRGLSALPEKSINLSIAMDLARILKAKGANVVATRSSDEFVSLDDRAATAESAQADLFVAIHADAHRNPDMIGATVYVGRATSPGSYRAAQLIAESLHAAGIQCRGVRDAGFRVLQGHSRPGVLVECGYLTNRTESQWLNDAGYRARIASAIAAGISNYFGG
jgi:N-acetylmuramoyl-L-alanine amidase